jgi:hypothetical protein
VNDPRAAIGDAARDVQPVDLEYSFAADGILRRRRVLQGLIDVERRRARNRWI